MRPMRVLWAERAFSEPWSCLGSVLIRVSKVFPQKHILIHFPFKIFLKSLFYLVKISQISLTYAFIISSKSSQRKKNHDKINPHWAYEWFVEHQHGDIIINIKTLRSFWMFHSLFSRFILLDTKCERVSKDDEDEHMILILYFFFFYELLAIRYMS